MPRGYVFAAKWDDGTAEVTITGNGIAEQRAGWARGLGGPRRILHGDVPKAGRMSYAEVLAYCAGRLEIPVERFCRVWVLGGVSYVVRSAAWTAGYQAGAADQKDGLTNDDQGSAYRMLSGTTEQLKEYHEGYHEANATVFSREA